MKDPTAESDAVAPGGDTAAPAACGWVEGSVCAPRGFRAAGIHCGIRRSHPDLALLASEAPASVAATFTTNRVQAAPVRYSRRAARRGRGRAVVVNSGVANACTGERGMEDARETARLAARALGVPREEVLVASTGLIGEPLPMDAVRRGVPRLVEALGPSADDASRAILTTDRFTKTAARATGLPGGPVVGGMAKGAGMIHPRMATTLGFLTTDAAVEPGLLSEILQAAVDDSFNRITVDGETSTNDAVFFLANGRAGGPPVSTDAAAGRLAEAATSVARRLARMVVEDGEGAERIARVRVTGAPGEGAARAVAERVARSLLVKTALRGGDPNWGRIMAALGSAGVELDPDRVEVRIGGVTVVRGGRGAGADPSAAREAMGADEVEIDVDLASGEGEHWIWTSDLGEEYVHENTRYTT